MSRAVPDAPPRRVGPLRSIRVRIVAAFVAALLILGGAQGFLIVQQQRIARSLQLITEGYVPLAQIVTLLERDRQRVENDVRRLLRDEPRPATGTSGAPPLFGEQLQENLAIGLIHAKQVQRRRDLPPEEQAVFRKVQSQLEVIDGLFSDYQRRAMALVDHAERGDRDAVQRLAEPLIDDGRLLSVEIETLARLLEARIDRQARSTEEAQVRATAAALSLTGLATLLSVLLIGAVLLALRPIGRLTTEVQRLAAGDYGGRVEVRGGDEIALLAAEFNAMVRALETRDRALVERAEELNRLSRYLASVLDGLADALLVVEAGTVTLTNPAAHRVWGAREGDPPPRALVALLGEPGRHEVPGPDGSLQEVRVAPLGGQGVVLVSADVTEQTLDKERLSRSERLALIGQMLAQITHEVRNPLNALSLNAELLADELTALDPEHRTEAWDLLGTVTREIDRLTAVTGHYLQLARRPPARLAEEDLEELARDVIRLQEAEFAHRGVVLHFRPAPLTRQLVDGNQLRQALLNVLRNAIEAGGRNLDLTLRREDDRVRFALFDDGPGMTPEEAERAADPFYSSKAQGTGLGLAITKQILEDHGGSLMVESTPGKGTTVSLLLPHRPAAP